MKQCGDLISIIVPVYKVEQYLDRCVKSIVEQTFTNFELILVDDGSPDKCPQLCDEWAKKDSRIKVIHKENGGLSDARNAGLQSIKGNYVAFVDSDDWIEPDMYQKLYHLLQRHPECQIAQCGVVSVSTDKKSNPKMKNKIKLYTKKDLLDYFYRVNGESSNTSVWNKLYRKEVLDGFSFVITLNEDVEAHYEFCTRANSMIETSETLYHYWINPKGITRSPFSQKDLDYLKVWDRIVERTRNEHPDYEAYAVMGRKRANLTMLAKMMFRNYDKTDPVLQNAKREMKKELRQDFWKLMQWKMPVSRKLLLIVLLVR